MVEVHGGEWVDMEELGWFQTKMVSRRRYLCVDQTSCVLRYNHVQMDLTHISELIPIHDKTNDQWKLIIHDNVHLQTWTFMVDSEQRLWAWIHHLQTVLWERHNRVHTQPLVIVEPPSSLQRITIEHLAPAV